MAIIEGSVRAGATFARSLSIRMPGYDLPPTGSFLMQFRRDKSSAPALVFSSADGSIQVTGWDSTSETVTLALLATSTQTAALAGTLHSNLIYQDGDSVDALDGNFLLRVDDGFSLSESPPAPSYGDISAWEPITDFTGADSATVLELMQRGARGPMPGHEWTGTALALQNIDGTWEAPVELKGEAAPNAWAPIVDFAAGISAQESQPTTVVRYQNETYIVAPGAGSFTTTGTFSPAQWVKIAAKGADGDGGDMMKLVYDANADGIVNHADMADAAPWAGITDKPSTFPPSGHSHPASEITDSTAAGRSILTAADAAAQRAVLGLGSSATLTAGSGANNVLQLDGSGKAAASILPTTDGLTEGATNLFHTSARVRATTLSGLGSGANTPIVSTDDILTAAANLQKQITTNATAISGLGTASTKNVGTSALNVVQLDASAKLPAVDGSQLTNVTPAVPIRGYVVFGWDGSTITISTSANVSSVVRNAVGNYTITWSTAMPSANYAVSGALTGPLTTGFVLSIAAATNGAAPILKTTTQLQIYTHAAAGGDVTHCCILAVGG